MAYRLNSYTERVTFPGDPEGLTFFKIRLGGRLAGDRHKILVAEELAAKGYKTEDDIPFDRAQELLHRSTCGTWILAYGGWVDEDGRLMERADKPDEDEVAQILRDPAVGNWFFGTVCTGFADKVQEGFKLAQGNSEPQPAGNGAGAPVIAN